MPRCLGQRAARVVQEQEMRHQPGVPPGLREVVEPRPVQDGERAGARRLDHSAQARQRAGVAQAGMAPLACLPVT